jgi:CHAT domain-containing protein
VQTRRPSNDPGSVTPDVTRSLQDELLDDETAALDLAVGDLGGYAWVVRLNSIRSFPLPARKVLESYAATVSSVMSDQTRAKRADSDPAFHHALAALSDAIIRPALRDLSVKRLLIIPDGALDGVPFGALPLDRSGALLIDRYEVAEAPSAGVLLALLRRREGPRPPHSIAIVADAVFGADSRLTKERAVSDHRFPRLVFSLREARSIATLAPPDAALFLGFDANKATFTDGRLKQYRVLHVSSHSLDSNLVLSRFDPGGSPRDGILSPQEVAHLDLPSELVVLSACRTSDGRSVPGEGTLSMARSFLYAGAQRVIAARWPVDDEASSILFRHFYEAFSKSAGASAAAALRQAQIALRREPRWGSPFYWAGFSLQGAFR